MDATCKEAGQEEGRSPQWQRLIASWLLVTGEQIVGGGGRGPVSLADHFDQSLGYAQINPAALNGGQCTTWRL
jgi:hypothetical protein